MRNVTITRPRPSTLIVYRGDPDASVSCTRRLTTAYGDAVCHYDGPLDDAARDHVRGLLGLGADVRVDFRWI